MNNLYNKIYEAVNTGIQKALIIDPDKDVSVKFYHKEISADSMTYDYLTVDLGLPSGLLWCEYNLGARFGGKTEDWYGDYYAWGETEIKNDYAKDTYKFYNQNKLTKYNDYDKLKVLEYVDDAVNKKLGDPFRMPTKEDYQELLENTTQKMVKNYKRIQGLNGILFMSTKNKKTLFFPCTGYYDGMNLQKNGVEGWVWTSSGITYKFNQSFYLYFDRYFKDLYSGSRYSGKTVRGVCDNI